MYTDYNIDYVLQSIPGIAGNLESHYQEYSDKTDYLKKSFFRQLNIIVKNQELQCHAEKCIKDLNQKKVDFKKTTEQNTIYLEQLESNTAKLNEAMIEKEHELSQLEKKLDQIIKKKQSATDETKEINQKKDEILTYKLLTNTSFLYTSKKITGIVVKNGTPKPFDFNPKNMAQEEITKELWKMVCEPAKEKK